MLEREHNKSFVQSLRYKCKVEEINSIFPLKVRTSREFLDKQDLTYAKHSNETKIYYLYPELRLKKLIKAFSGVSKTVIGQNLVNRDHLN